MYIDDFASDDLSVEAQVARARGDDDWEDIAYETPRWISGGTRAKTYERDRMDFDRVTRTDTDDWRN